MEAAPFRTLRQSQPYEAFQRLPATVVLDSIRSLYNVGSFFRTADAAGARLLLCGYTGAPPHRGVAKTALGAERSVEWERRSTAVEALKELRRSGHEIAVVETALHAVDLFDWRPRFPVAVVFGNEVEGVSAETSGLADLHVRLPMLGAKQSLNVAVAGGVVLFELLRKYRELHSPQGLAASACESR